MFSITKLYEFESAHQLTSSCASAECERMHGHSYKAKVTITAHYLNAEEMVVNFNELDEVVKPVVEFLDHRVLVPTGPDTGPAAYYSAVPNIQTAALSNALRNTTAERLAQHFGELVVAWLRGRDDTVHPQFDMVMVTVNETRKCQAGWSGAV